MFDGVEANVVIGLLVGGSLLLSAGVGVVDRLASVTSTCAGKARLARRLDGIGHPPGGLLEDDMTVLAREVPGCDDRQIRAVLRRGAPGNQQAERDRL